MLSAGEYEVLKDIRVKSVSTGAETPFVKATGGWVCVWVCLCVLCAGVCVCACDCVCCVSHQCGVCVRACVRACVCVRVHVDAREEIERVTHGERETE